MLENHERHFEYNGLLEITEILIVRCIFELKFHQIRFLLGLRPGPRWGACKYNVPRLLLGWGDGRPSHPLCPSSALSFPVGPRCCGVRIAYQMVNPALLLWMRAKVKI